MLKYKIPQIVTLTHYLIVKCRHTNKTSGKDATGLHGAS